MPLGMVIAPCIMAHLCGGFYFRKETDHDIVCHGSPPVRAGDQGY